jgi:hypothetical protein
MVDLGAQPWQVGGRGMRLGRCRRRRGAARAPSSAAPPAAATDLRKVRLLLCPSPVIFVAILPHRWNPGRYFVTRW